ncbi:MAG TPA: sugar ABC transporter permease [Chloroflexota bacterium]|nr:sugar ABC transporter permease [Chloroflexota bacterium]
MSISAPPRVGSLRAQRRREMIEAYLYLLPTFVGLILFSLGAIIFSVGISFTDWDILQPPHWVGLSNYVRLFTTPLNWQVFGNTLYYTAVIVPVGTALALGLALALNRGLRGIVILRGLYFLPVISSTVAVSLVWGWLYNQQFGLINYLLSVVGITGPAWLADTRTAMPAVLIMSIWKGLGYNMVIFLAGLQGIPQELYEAAKIDGAGAWARFRYVTLPLVSPTTFFVVVLSTVAAFQVFDQTYVMTNGGPAYSTTTLALFIYQNAFQWFHMGYAAALSYVLFAAVAVVILLQFRAQGRFVFYR